VTFTKVRERAFEPTDIHHPLHPLHDLVLDELEEWVEADEGWQDFPESPDELHALERRQPEAPSRQLADGDESQATERVRHWAALASSQRALENHSSAGKNRKPAERSGLFVVKIKGATKRATSLRPRAPRAARGVSGVTRFPSSEIVA
jgi:hypothetical protein